MDFMKTSKFWNQLGLLCTCAGAGIALVASMCANEEQKAYIDSKIQEQIQKVMNASNEAIESV